MGFIEGPGSLNPAVDPEVEVDGGLDGGKDGDIKDDENEVPSAMCEGTDSERKCSRYCLNVHGPKWVYLGGFV